MTRRKVLTAGSVVVLLVGLMAGAMGTALAVHNDNLFELDTSTDATLCDPLPAPCGNADTQDDPAGGADDWANVYKSFTGLGSAGPDDAFARTFITDPVSAAENSYYTGGGSKDVNDIPQWSYATANDPVPDKDDIANAFAAAYRDADNHTVFYFGMDRYDNNGDAEAGFWFFKSPVSLGANGKFTGVHTVGDVLVLANWGGSNPVGEITVYHWVGGKNPLVLDFDSLAADCATADTNDNICATVNRENDDPEWPFLDKSGSTVIRPLELFEAGIDLNAVLGQESCFSTFLASTRSSHSTTAQLKDFALGSFEQCTPTLTTTPSAGSGGTVTPGTSVTDTLVVQGQGLAVPPTPSGTATFFLCGPIASGLCETGGTNIGTGTLADSSPPAGEATAVSPAVNTAASPLAPGRYCFRAEWPGDTNYKPVAPATKFVHFGTGNVECFNVSDTSTTTSVQTWLPNDSATVTSAGGSALNGTLSFTLYSGGTCSGTVLRSAETFTLTNAASPATRTTTNSTVSVTASTTVSWLVTFTSSNANVSGSSHCETTVLTITN